MDFLSLGNIITLAITGALFTVFRVVDRKNRNIKAARDYGRQLEEQLKKELSQYIEKKKNEVTGFGALLAANKSSAKAVLLNIETKLAECQDRLQTLDKVQQRLTSYDSSLNELAKMTVRVEDNLQRIASETEFVERVALDIDRAKEQFETLLTNLAESRTYIETSIEESLQKAEAAIKERADELKRSAQESASALRTDIENLNTQLSTQKDDIARFINDRTDELKHAAQETTSALRTDIENLDAQLSTQKDDVARFINDRADELKHAAQEATSALRTDIENLDVQLSTQKDDVAHFINDRTDELKNAAQEATSALHTDIENLDAQLSTQKDDIARFINDRTDELKHAAQEATSALRTDIENLDAQLSTQKDDIARFIKEETVLIHSVLDGAEQERAARIEQDAACINTMLKEVVDNAGVKAEHLEGQLYDALRNQIEDRSARFKDELDDTFKELRLNTQNEIAALNDTFSEDMRGLRGDAEDLRLVSTEVSALEQTITAAINEANNTLAAYKQRADDAAAALKNELSGLAESAKNAALETAAEHFKAYQDSEEALKKQFAEGQETARALDAELRLQLESTQESIKKQIAAIEKETSLSEEKINAQFNTSFENLSAKLRGVENDIEKIKRDAYERTEENIRQFEETFGVNLARRSENFETRFNEWRVSMNARFDTLTENQGAECRQVEMSFNESLRKKAAELDTKFLTELERIKNAAAQVEEETHKQMENAVETLNSFREQLKHDFTGLRESSLAALNTEIGRNALENADKLKNYFREIENEQKHVKEQIDEKNVEINAALLKSRKEFETQTRDIDASFHEFSARINDLQQRGKDAIAETEHKINAVRESVNEVNTEISRCRQELFSGTEQRAKTLEAAIADTEEKITGFFEQGRLIEKTLEMKNDLNRGIEDVRDELQRLELQKADLINLESQFAKLKRMEDDVNAKMSRFLTEQRHIELMEEDFKKLLETKSAVDEKLASLTEHNDNLQELQLKMRKFSDALTETEEKYQRIEKKNQILDATNEGIDRNFKALQESEKTAKQFAATVDHLSVELTEIRIAVDNLSQENAKVVMTSEKLEGLDSMLAAIEERIDTMQKARQWLADLESRMDQTYADAKFQAKLAGDMLKKEGLRGSSENSSVTLSQREQVIKLSTHQGWSADEIARTLKISRAAVELILEMPPKN